MRGGKNPFINRIIWVVLGLLVVLGVTIAILKFTGAKYVGRMDYRHPSNYAGVVWVKLKPQSKNLGQTHHFKLKWGPWLRPGEINFADTTPVFLIHKKENPHDAPPIQFTIDPPCQITFGQGTPPGGKIVDINGDWFQAR